MTTEEVTDWYDHRSTRGRHGTGPGENHSLTANRNLTHNIADGTNKTYLVCRVADSGELRADLDCRLLEWRRRIQIVGLVGVEVHDPFDVGHDIVFYGLVVRE